LVVSGEACYQLTAENTVIIFRNPDWILVEDAIISLETDGALDLLEAFLDSNELLIPKEDESEFLDRFILALAEKIELVGDGVSWEDISLEPVRRLYLNDAGGALEVILLCLQQY
jgi:non-specific serine/threonine protein kinase